jgi:uncharacterized protein
MKFHLARADGRNAFTGYGTGYVSINGTRYTRSLVVLPDRILDWNVASFDDITQSEFDFLASLPLEVVVLGTGSRLRFPAAAHAQTLSKAGIGLEVMDTHAACRTYNVLLAEDRRVGAALLIPAASGGAD